MAAPQYGIGAFNFDFWRGPAPSRVQNQGRVFTKPGVDGIGTQTVGIFGSPFEVTLVSWWAPDGTADAAMGSYAALQFAGPQPLLFNGIVYNTVYNLHYHVIDFQPIRVDRKPLLRRAGAGGTLLSPGDENISRWTLQPEYIEPPPEP